VKTEKRKKNSRELQWRITLWDERWKAANAHPLLQINGLVSCDAKRKVKERVGLREHYQEGLRSDEKRGTKRIDDLAGHKY